MIKTVSDALSAARRKAFPVSLFTLLFDGRLAFDVVTSALDPDRYQSRLSRPSHSDHRNRLARHGRHP